MIEASPMTITGDFTTLPDRFFFDHAAQSHAFSRSGDAAKLFSAANRRVAQLVRALP
jgi:hypothetical protein